MSTRLRTLVRLPNESWWWTGRHLRWHAGSLMTQWKKGSHGHPQSLFLWLAAWSAPGWTAQRSLSNEIVKWESCRRYSWTKKGSTWSKTVSIVWRLFTYIVTTCHPFRTVMVNICLTCVFSLCTCYIVRTRECSSHDRAVRTWFFWFRLELGLDGMIRISVCTNMSVADGTCVCILYSKMSHSCSTLVYPIAHMNQNQNLMNPCLPVSFLWMRLVYLKRVHIYMFVLSLFCKRIIPSAFLASSS